LGHVKVLLGMFLSLKTLYRKRTVIWPFYFYTIIRTLSDFKNLNKYFQKFSKNYLKEHCYFRKILHLPIKGALHRLQFKLYGTHWNYLALVSKLAFIVFIFIIISPLYFTIIFYIANWVEKIAYFILNDLH
ncbi:hypothetical protein F6X86_14185, partial [Enterococcus durans]